LLRELPDLHLAFVEEMFPENVDQYRELKAFLRQQRLKTLIADGEGQSTLQGLAPCIEARVVDVYQADMNRFGFEGILQEATTVGTGGFVGPHNWGSLVGFYMILHIGRAVANFYRAENDPLDNDVLIADGYTIVKGSATVPDAPGFGLKINEAKFASTIKPGFDLKL
jgi:L-alanine-DL-glutamate epimerase-like enolase superfamily enzyme